MSKNRQKQAQSFLNDECGQNALLLAARGSTIIAEICRLSQHIPSCFRQPEKSPEYSKIICDFKYFTFQDKFEKTIQNSAELLARDDEFRETHLELLERFFRLFRGVHGYAMELNRYLEEIRECLYISQTLESILVNEQGKQLLCELFYLFGVMLLLLDYKVGGRVREYLIVSYIRYRGAGEQHTVDITQMCRDTGYVFGQKLPDLYPTHYFARVRVDLEVIGMLIGRMRSDDIYQMTYNYPAPEHRSTALANQASMLFVLLYFRPEILHHERPVMREIVDKHFADNWVINYYMGFTADLAVWWTPFKAANAAIQGTIAMETVTYHQHRMRRSLGELNKSVAENLREGKLDEQYVLDNIHSSLLPLLREANVTLRWFILHMTRGSYGRKFLEANRKSYEYITEGIELDQILTLLFGTAQLEFILKSWFAQLLKEKRAKWEKAKAEGAVKMQKLSTYFSGEHVLSDNVKMAQLEDWFTDISTRIEGLSFADSTTASRKIQKLIKALESVQEFHHVDSNLQVVQFLQDTRFLLRQMIRYINIERKVLIAMATIGDLSYAWELFSFYGCFVGQIQDKIKSNPHLAIQMRSVFVKLASVVELPCTRIDQASVSDSTLVQSLESVSEYYSGELVVFVRKVLHIIPISIFNVLQQIAKVLHKQKADHEEFPTKLAKKLMKSHSQLPLRYQLARHTSDISKFANGMLAMESCLVGVIEVNPHKLLEDGIRKELTRQVTHVLHDAVRFDPKKVPTAEEFDAALQKLHEDLNGTRESFEYIQDYVNVHGPRIWLEEFSRIVNFNVEMECNAFMQKKLYHWKSKYQSDSIPIPYFERASESDPYSFLGRVVYILLQMTDPRRAMYVPALGSWYELASAREVVCSRTFNSLLDAIGTQGLSALDRLLCFMVARDLQFLVTLMRKSVEPHADLFQKIKADLTPASGIPLVAGKHYQSIDNVLTSVFNNATEVLLRVGRMQLIRNHLANELRSSCKLNSGALFCALVNANDALVADIQHHYKKPAEHPMPGEIVPELSSFLVASGMGHPQSQIYITAKPLPELCFLLVGLVVKNLPRVIFDDRLCCLLPKKPQDNFDAAPFAFATMLLLRQFHSETRDLFFAHLSQYVRVVLCDFEHADGKVKEKDILPESSCAMVHMLELLAQAAGVDMDQFHRMIPPQLLGEPRRPTMPQK